MGPGASRKLSIRIGTSLIGAGATALWLTSTFALAQQTDDEIPPRLTFDASTSLNYNDNPDLAVGGSDALTSLDTRLGLTFHNETEGQSFHFALEGLARLKGSDGLILTGPSADLAYDRDNGNSTLSLNGLYQQVPGDLFEPVLAPDGTVSNTDILATTGTITTTTAGFRFATGLQRPLGFDLAANYSGRAYSDTTDPSVYDNASRDVKAGLRYRLASGDEASLTATESGTDYQNPENTTQRAQDLSLGYDADLRPDLRLQASLGSSTASTTEAGLITNESNGAIGSLGLTADMPNGTASASLSSSRDSLGSRQVLSFGRSLDLPSGKLEASLGLSQRTGSNGQPVGNLSWVYDLPRDSFDVILSRQVSLNSDDQDIANTTLGVTYRRQINDVSSLGLSVNLLATGSDGGVATDDALRQTITTSYSHDLTPDWQMSAGYQFRSLDQYTTGTAQSNTVFLTISRKFTLRP